ncbi:MAG: hypothetical protein OEX22_12840 [Cyclobacteriaceae bacterium]|nr:hypothetical protein [Cyclobacteriaceae bacterium]
MRIVKEVPHPNCKITVFSWNDKYIIKFEKGSLEQTFKVKEWDIIEENELNHFFEEDFISKVLLRFDGMINDLNTVMTKI